MKGKEIYIGSKEAKDFGRNKSNSKSLVYSLWGTGIWLCKELSKLIQYYNSQTEYKIFEKCLVIFLLFAAVLTMIISEFSSYGFY